MPCHHIRECPYLYDAVAPPDGEVFGLVMSCADTVCMSIFLEQLAGTYPNEYILPVMDNAALHYSKILEIPRNIDLYSLLPFTQGMAD